MLKIKFLDKNNYFKKNTKNIIMKKVLIFAVAMALVSCKETKKVETEESPVIPKVTTTEAQTSKEEGVTKAEEISPLSSKTLNEETISVTKAKVIGKVLYVEVLVKTSGNSSLNVMNVKEINYVDDSEVKKHEVLKDDEGIYQASPLQYAKSNKLQVMTSSSKPEALISLKFAAPPTTSKTITLNLPDFGSFDAIPISRTL